MKKLRLLSSKLTLFSTLIVFITMAIITVITYTAMKSFFIQEAIQNLETETELISNDIENSLIKLENDLAILSKTPPINGIIRSDENNGQDPLENSNITIWKDRLAVIFDSMLKVNPQYTQIRYVGVNNDGKEIVRVNQSRGEIFRTHESALQSKGDEPYYQQGIKLSQGSIEFSAITYNREKGKITIPLTPTLRVIMPIYTDKQKIFGLLLINVNIKNYLQDVLNRTAKNYNVIIYDKFNDYFIYNYKNQTLSFYQGDEKIPEGLFGTPSVNTTNKILPYLKKNAKNYFIVTRKIHSSLKKSRTVFTMLTATPKSTVLKQYHSLLNNLLFSIIGLSLLASFAIYLFVKKMMMNLSKMAETIQNARSADDTNLKLPTHLHDEVGMLARAFEQKTKLLSELALYDSLTGLPNRKRFMDHLHEALNRANRKKYSVAVTYIDLNNFKEVNDKYGHDYGDELLVKFAYKLKTIARATDLCARLSGDEFAIISEDIQEDINLDKFTSRLNRELNQTYEVKGIAIQVTVGAGLSLYPDYASSAEELMSQSDEMMYESKKEGKGRIHIYKPEKQS